MLDIADMDSLNKIIQNSKLKKLEILYLHGAGEMGTLKTRDFLAQLLQITTRQIFIDSFKLSEEDTNIIFDNWYRTKSLSLVNWEITNIGEGFKIPKNRDYKLEQLDLYWTCIQGDDKYLDEHKLPNLLRAIYESKNHSFYSMRDPF